jgi:hypothetical protein
VSVEAVKGVPAMYEFIVAAGTQGFLLLAIAALISWLFKTIPEIFAERRKAQSVLLWIEIEARLSRDQLRSFDATFHKQKHSEIEEFASRNQPYRMITAISNQPNEYDEWKRYIVRYPVELVKATALYIELDVMIDGLLQKMETESFEKLGPERQKRTIDIFMTLCAQKAKAIDALLGQIEARHK